MAPSTVLVATDFSKPADLALEAGVHWAEHLGAQVRILHLLDDWRESLDDAYRQLAERTRRVNGAGLDCSCELLSRCATAPSFKDIANVEADWLFVGTRGRTGFRRFAHGSWTEAAIRTARCPVISVPHETRISKEQSTIVVGADLSEQSTFALDQLRSVGEEVGCTRFVLVHACPAPPDMVALFQEQGTPLPSPDLRGVSASLDELLRSIREQGYQADLVATCEGSADAILRVAREESADLIAIGTHGRRGFPHLLLGSVAEDVIRHAPCPVMTARLFPRRPLDGTS